MLICVYSSVVLICCKEEIKYCQTLVFFFNFHGAEEPSRSGFFSLSMLYEHRHIAFGRTPLDD